MYKSIVSALSNWNASTNERQKLQHSYLFTMIVGVLVAGVVGLIEPTTGHNLVRIALYALLVFLANAVVWNFLQSAVISKLPSRSRRK